MRVAIKLLSWFAFFSIIIFSLRYVFNVQTQPRAGTQTFNVASLAIHESLSFTRVGREMLLLRTGAERFLLVHQRSPEFSCLLEVSADAAGVFLKDPCSGDLFDLQGRVLPGQRASRDLNALPYRWLPPDQVLIED